MIEIGPLRPGDRAAWDVLACGYKAFYQESEPDEAYERTWQRLAAGTELFGLGARLDSRPVGIRHRAVDAPWVSARGTHGQLDLAPPLRLFALLGRQLGMVARLAHDQRDPGPQGAARDRAGVLRIEPGANVRERSMAIGIWA